MWRKDVRCLWLLPPLPKHGPAVGSPVDGFLPNTSSKSAQRATLRGNTRQAYTSSSGEDRFAFFSESLSSGKTVAVCMLPYGGDVVACKPREALAQAGEDSQAHACQVQRNSTVGNCIIPPVTQSLPLGHKSASLGRFSYGETRYLRPAETRGVTRLENG